MTDTMTDTTRVASTVVLVHGAWHGAWCWAGLQSELDARGVPSYAIDLPGHGASPLPLADLQGDAALLTATLDHLDLAEAVLVGHSYGGAVISQAASGRSDLAHLVYVAAFALETGESVMSALRSFERRDVALSAAMVPHDDGSTSLDPDLAPAALYGDCSPETRRAAVARLDRQPGVTMTTAVDGSPRDHIESTYIRCSNDAAVHPDHQTVMAERCTTRIDLDAGHSPFLSAPGRLADVIADISDGIGIVDRNGVDADISADGSPVQATS